MKPPIQLNTCYSVRIQDTCDPQKKRNGVPVRHAKESKPRLSRALFLQTAQSLRKRGATPKNRIIS